MTKIAFGAQDYAEIESWFGNRDSLRLTTRYLPKRHGEMVGGSLYWIHKHALVARSPILGFSEAPDGRWWIDLAPELIRVYPTPKRAHQGWRYLTQRSAPRDLEAGEDPGDAIPGRLAGKLEKLGLI